jgi:hypothetical protein
VGETRHPHPMLTAKKILEREERNAEIIHLKRLGHSHREIAKMVGCHPDTITDVHREAIAEVRDQMFTDTALYVAESLDRLGALLAAMMPRALAGDVKCATECRLIVSAMADFTGAKAPVRHEWQESDVDRAIRELGEVLERRAGADAGQAADPADASG